MATGRQESVIRGAPARPIYAHMPHDVIFGRRSGTNRTKQAKALTAFTNSSGAEPFAGRATEGDEPRTA